MERAVYDRMHALEGEHWWFSGRRAVLAAVIERIARPPEGGRILEAGCGTGGNLDLLSRYGAVDAFEPDAGAGRLAAERSGLEIVQAGLPELEGFSGADYDLIGMFDVLEHVEDDRAALEALRTRLKPGGKLLLSVPAFAWLWSAHDVEHHHFRRYAPRELRERAQAAGFSVEAMSAFNTWLFPPIVAVRLAKGLAGAEGSDDAMPPRPINHMLASVFASEAHLAGRLSLPVGTSIWAVLSPQAAA